MLSWLEARLFPMRGQQADPVKPNLVVGGPGRVWIDRIELWQTPLKA